MSLLDLRVFKVFRRGLDTINLNPVKGTTIAGEREIKAIVKFKGGLKRASQLRRTASDLTVHVRPEDVDDFPNPQDIIGSAIRWKGRYYSVDGVSVGRNYETGVDEHITLNCSLAIYTDTRPKFCREKDRNIILTSETGRPFMVEKWETDVQPEPGGDGDGGDGGEGGDGAEEGGGDESAARYIYRPKPNLAQRLAERQHEQENIIQRRTYAIH